MAGRVTADDKGQLKIEFPYHPGLVQLVKGLPGRRWSPDTKEWIVPAESTLTVVETLKDAGFTFDEGVLRLYEAQRGRAGDDLTISQLNLRVRTAVSAAFPSPVWIVGEISGFAKSSHKRVVDFQLVERGAGGTVAQVTAVLFGDARQAIEARLAREGDPFRLEDELTVRLLVLVDLHAEWGAYRVIVQDLDVSYTLGEAARRREEILRQLTAEWLIGRNRALSFPPVPLRVGLITSLGSDAERDVLQTLHESGFAFEVTVHGARVQGRATEASVLNALTWFRDNADAFDLVLICRGGGSRTDLGWFDSLALGRAVASFPLAVVIGIGHEQDRSVLDEVGWRAKTPTAAAQLVVQQVQDTLEHMQQAVTRSVELAALALERARRDQRERSTRVSRSARRALERAAEHLAREQRRLATAARGFLRAGRERLAYWTSALPRLASVLLGAEGAHLSRAPRRLIGASRRLLALERERVNARARRLALLDPRRVVERGYTILRLDTGSAVTSADQAPPGTRVRAELRRGMLRLRSEGDEET